MNRDLLARDDRLRLPRYTTDAAPALIGFGAAAISAPPQGYARNIAAAMPG